MKPEDLRKQIKETIKEIRRSKCKEYVPLNIKYILHLLEGVLEILPDK